MTTQEQRTEYRQRIEAARHQLTPERAWDWEGDQLTDALMAVDIVANTVMDEAKKNPVQAQPGFLWEPPTNRYLFGQTMHDVGRAVMDKLIGAGWVPPSRMSASENSAPRPAPDVSWVTTEPVYEGPAWMHWTKLIGSILLMAVAAASFIVWMVKL